MDGSKDQDEANANVQCTHDRAEVIKNEKSRINNESVVSNNTDEYFTGYCPLELNPIATNIFRFF